MINWYNELQNYDKHTPIIAISYGGILYSHLSEIKHQLNIDFDIQDANHSIKFTFWSNYKIAFPMLIDGKWAIHEIPRSPTKISHDEKVWRT